MSNDESLAQLLRIIVEQKGVKEEEDAVSASGMLKKAKLKSMAEKADKCVAQVLRDVCMTQRTVIKWCSEVERQGEKIYNVLKPEK